MTIPTEHHEQVALFAWAALAQNHYPELGTMFAIPNGGKRYMTTAKSLKAEGVKPGIPDIFLPVARHCYHGLFIEMKRTKRSRVSDTQWDWLNRLEEEGYRVAVCHGCEEAIKIIEDYLK